MNANVDVIAYKVDPLDSHYSVGYLLNGVMFIDKSYAEMKVPFKYKQISKTSYTTFKEVLCLETLVVIEFGDRTSEDESFQFIKGFKYLMRERTPTGIVIVGGDLNSIEVPYTCKNYLKFRQV